jgi:hypothetical protein
LKFATDWVAYCKSGKKPNDIPSNPQKTYDKSGWAGMSDWLGYVRSGRRSEVRSKKATGEAPAPADASRAPLFDAVETKVTGSKPRASC